MFFINKIEVDGRVVLGKPLNCQTLIWGI